MFLLVALVASVICAVWLMVEATLLTALLIAHGLVWVARVLRH